MLLATLTFVPDHLDSAADSKPKRLSRTRVVVRANGSVLVVGMLNHSMDTIANPRNDSSPQAFMHIPLPGCQKSVALHSVSRTVPSHRNLCVTNAVSPHHCAEAGAPIFGVLHEAADACANLMQALGRPESEVGVLPLPPTLCNRDDEGEWMSLELQICRPPIWQHVAQELRGWVAALRCTCRRAGGCKYCTNASGV